MAEYIDRQRIRDEVCKDCTYRVRADGCVYQVLCDKLLVAFIEAEPAADVAPVVRCRECKHYRETRTKRYGNLICRCTRMGKHDMDYRVKPDDFCSYGER